MAEDQENKLENGEEEEEEASVADLSISDQWDEIVSRQALGDNVATAERLLTQDEIDAILGFQALEDDAEPTSGLSALIGSGQISYDRLPMFEVMLDRLVRLMTVSMRRFTSDAVDVVLQSISSMRMEEYLNSTYLTSVIAVVRAEEWDNLGLVTVDADLAYGMIEVLLGGARQSWAQGDGTRPYSSLELNMVRSLVKVICGDIEKAFKPISELTMSLQRMETNPRFVSIVRPSNTAVVATLRVDMDMRGGNIHVVFPHATLEPVRNLLLQQFQGERFGHDNLWEQHLVKELWKTELDLAAVLGECEVSLDQLLHLKVGQTLMIDGKSDQSVMVTCEGMPAFRGSIGHMGAYVAVCADEKINISGQERRAAANTVVPAQQAAAR